MRANQVVVATPDFDNGTNLGSGAEPLQRQALVAELAVKTLISTVLPGLAGVDQRGFDVLAGEPVHIPEWHGGRIQNRCRIAGGTALPRGDHRVAIRQQQERRTAVHLECLAERTGLRKSLESGVDATNSVINRFLYPNSYPDSAFTKLASRKVRRIHLPIPRPTIPSHRIFIPN